MIFAYFLIPLLTIILLIWSIIVDRRLKNQGQVERGSFGWGLFSGILIWGWFYLIFWILPELSHPLLNQGNFWTLQPLFQILEAILSLIVFVILFFKVNKISSFVKGFSIMMTIALVIIGILTFLALIAHYG